MKRLLSGNEAVALGAWEAGVRYASAYPGTPSTEILENLATYKGVQAEWASNEKVALDTAIGASYAHVRALAAMKHVGVNVAADALFAVAFSGVRAGLVIVTADDPGCWSSQNEQDNRQYARFTKIPCLEPSDSQEAHDFVQAALDLSEQFDTPVLLRLTTRICHSKSVVHVNPPQGETVTPPAGHFDKDAQKFVMIPAHARRRHPYVEERLRRLAAYAETTPLNRVEWKDRNLGIVTSSISYQYATEIFPNASILKLGMAYPLPAQMIRDFAAGVERLIVLEELDPFFEEQIKALGIACEGKTIFPIVGEFSLSLVRQCAVQAGLLPAPAGAPTPPPPEVSEWVMGLPPRIPALCPGCSHRSVFYALNKFKATVVGDIGCYSIGVLPPFNAMDVITCMGASIGIFHGMAQVGATANTVAVIGDSTFFHSGMAPLANMVYNKVPGVILILDNAVTGMTGQQGNPASGQKLQGEAGVQIDIVNVVRALGVKHVEAVDAFDQKAVEKAIKAAMADKESLSVIVVRGPCVQTPAGIRREKVQVDPEVCNGCSLCFRVGCPAILQGELDAQTHKPKAVIDPILCVGCDICLQVCPRHAIFRPAAPEPVVACA